jgi:ribosomal protein L37E
MNWHHFACNRCNATLRTPIDNPNSHFVCASCDHRFFHEITKDDYDKERKRAPFPK